MAAVTKARIKADYTMHVAGEIREQATMFSLDTSGNLSAASFDETNNTSTITAAGGVVAHEFVEGVTF
jgi:hypothetical protein